MSNKEICYIFGSVPITDTRFLRRYRVAAQNLLVICADGGLFNARKAGLRPDVLIGDEDSGGTARDDIFSLTLPKQKDETDLQACIDYALEHGCKTMYLFGCTGGRLDHFLANVYLLEYIKKRNARGVIADSDNEIFLHEGLTMMLQNKQWFDYVSLIPIDDEITGVTLHNMKYPLNMAAVRRDTPLGISNEPTAQSFEITVAHGQALVIFSRDAD